MTGQPQGEAPLLRVFIKIMPNPLQPLDIELTQLLQYSISCTKLLCHLATLQPFDRTRLIQCLDQLVKSAYLLGSCTGHHSMYLAGGARDHF